MSNTLRNRGLAGSVLDATNEGLVRVEGPAIWTTDDRDPIHRVLSAPHVAGSLYDTFEATFRLDKYPDDGPDSYACVAGLVVATGYVLIYFDETAGNAYVKPRVFWMSENNTMRDSGSAAWGADVNKLPGWYSISIDATASPAVVTYKFSPELTELPPTTWPISSTKNVDLPSLQIKLAVNSVVAAFGGLSYSGTNACINTVFGAGEMKLDGEVIASFTQQDIANSDPDADVLAGAAGAPMSISRNSTGPVTTIVPRGVELVNPDPTNSALRVDIPNNTFDHVSSTEDAVLAVLYRPTATTSGFVYRTGVSTGVLGWIHGAGPQAYLRTDSGVQAVSAPSGVVAAPNSWAVGFLVLNRATASVRGVLVWADGIVRSGPLTPIAALPISPAASVIQQAQPGSFRTAMFRKGVGIAAEYTDEALAALASYLLNEV